MTGDEVLALLRAADGFVSGQELCGKLNVSRAAVWKHIVALRGEGYEIEAVRNRGYRLVGAPDAVTGQEISGFLETSWIGRDIRYYPRVGSTNAVARMLGEEGAKEGILVVTNDQTDGRGRRGRSWRMPAGSSVAMSLLLRPGIPPSSISMVTLVMGLAAAQSCRQLYGLEAMIKWPNDIVCGGKKLSGTLTELSSEPDSIRYLVIGTGINANLSAFPDELKDTAVSLLELTGHSVNRAELIAAVLKNFEIFYEEFLRTADMSALKDRYNELLVNAGKQVRVLDSAGSYTGTALGINDRGELLVKLPSGEISEVYAGEVSVRGIAGYV